MNLKLQKLLRHDSTKFQSPQSSLSNWNFCKKLVRNSHHYKWIRQYYFYFQIQRIYSKLAFVIIVLAFKQNRLKLKGSSNYVAPVNSRPARQGRVKPSNLKSEKMNQILDKLDWTPDNNDIMIATKRWRMPCFRGGIVLYAIVYTFEKLLSQ